MNNKDAYQTVWRYRLVCTFLHASRPIFSRQGPYMTISFNGIVPPHVDGNDNKKESEYDQEIPQLSTADQPTAP